MTPRLLVVVTLAEAGGAQTFAAELVAGLRERYAIEVAAHGPGGALVEACAALGIPFHHVRHLVRDPHPYHDAAAVRELRSLARAIGPDIVQINSSKAGVLARLALARTGAKTVFTAHGWAFSGRGGAAGAIYTTAERAVAPLSDAIVCVSNHDLQLARERHIKPRGGLHVIHNGVDAPPALARRRAARRAARARLHRAAGTAEGPDHPARRARAARLRALGAARLRRRARPRARSSAHVGELGLGDRVTTARPPRRHRRAARRLRRLRADQRLGGSPLLHPRGHGGRPAGARDGRRRDRRPRRPGRDGRARPGARRRRGRRVLAAWAADPSRLPVLGAAAHARARASFSREQMVGRYDALFGSLLAG